MRRLFCFTCALCALWFAPGRALAQAAPPIKVGDAVVSTSLRSRMFYDFGNKEPSW